MKTDIIARLQAIPLRSDDPTLLTDAYYILIDVAEAAAVYLNHVAEAAAWSTPGVGCDGTCEQAAALRAIFARLDALEI